MTQTLFGLTLPQAVSIAEQSSACDYQLDRVKHCSTWDRVLNNTRLRGWLDFMVYNLTPNEGCGCSICQAREARLTPEVRELVIKLRAIYEEAMGLDVGLEETHDFIAAKLREHLSEIPDAVRADAKE